MPPVNNFHWGLKMVPEAILFKAERGLRAALLEAAQKERQSASEYVRRRLRAELQADGIELPPFDLRPAPPPGGPRSARAQNPVPGSAAAGEDPGKYAHPGSA